MQPTQEAVAWAERADAWAQRPPEGERGGQHQLSRWSDVAATGRPAFPADGVGWRSQTAEWRATEQTARWRQTTEWRSASGTHGWRSTTEAWQSGAGAEDLRPPVDPPTRQQNAISGTAWPTPEGDQPSGSAFDAAGPSTDNGPGTGSWRRDDSAPPWQPATDASPAWRRFASPPTPWEPPPAAAPWQSGAGAHQAPRTTGEARTSAVERDTRRTGTDRESSAGWQSRGSAGAWERPADGASRDEPATGSPDELPRTPGSGAPWRPSDPPPWQPPETTTSQPADPAPWHQTPPSSAGRQPRASWQQLVEPEAETTTPAYGGGLDAGRHLVREDDRARWRRDSAAAERDARPGGRRRAPEPGARGSAGTGWSTRADSDNWAGHADTGSIRMFDDSAVADAPSWGARADAPSWRRPEPDVASRQASGPGALGWQRDEDRDDDTPGRRRSSAAPLAWQDDDRGRQPRREGASGTQPRREGGRRRAESDRPSWGESAPARETPSWQRSAPPAIGWQAPEDDDRDGDRRDLDDDVRRRDAPGWRPEDRDTRGRRLDDPDGRGWEDTGSITGDRRRAAAPADPWAHTAADTGVIPLNGEPPSIDSGSWQSATDTAGRARPANPNRRRDDDDPRLDDDDPRPGGTSSRISETGSRIGETGSRIGGSGGRSGETSSRIGRRRAAEDDASVDPAVWRREPGSGTGAATWPVEGQPADWRRELGTGAGAADRPVTEQPADWRRELRGELEPPVGDAVTEVRRRIDPAVGLPGRDHTARGTASYREGNTGDWRRELAADDGGLAEGESRRYATQDFVPFRPVGSASVAPAPAPVSAPPEPAPRREQLLVRGASAGAPVEAPEQWPPRRPTGYQSPDPDYPGAATGAYERRPVSGGLATAPGRPTDLLEPDEDEFEEDTGGPLAAVGYTVVWYGVPVVLFVLYMLVLNGSQQAQALSTLAEAAPQFGLSLVLSMVVAVGLRWASGSWKAVSVGLAAAVMGGGLATVLASAITGNPLT